MKQKKLFRKAPPVEARLATARQSEEFHKRCEDAGKLALHINRLKTVTRDRAPERIPLGRRVKALAALAKVPLAPVLRWFGLKEVSLADSDAALAVFGRELGFESEDFFQCLRATAEADAGIVVPVSARGRRTVGVRLDNATESRLRALKRAIEEEYSFNVDED